MSKNKVFFYGKVFFAFLWVSSAFALTDPTRGPAAENGDYPVEGVIVKQDKKIVFLSGKVVSEGDQTPYGKMKTITFDGVSFRQDAKDVTQSIASPVKKEKLN